jgi:hypothetical protein
MGKSIRSKIKKKFRSIKRKQLEPFVVEQVRLLYSPASGASLYQLAKVYAN